MAVIKLSREKILLGIICWFGVFLLLSYSGWNYFQSLNILGFTFLAAVPGYLALSAFGAVRLDFWRSACLAVGLSVLGIMIAGSIGNILLPLFFGVARPLDKIYSLVDLEVLLLLLAAFSWRHIRPVKLEIKKYIFFDNFLDVVFVGLPLIFVFLAVFGAIRLNNGAGNILTVVMLWGIFLFVPIIVVNARRRDPKVIPAAIYLISLALLLMTSLRGWTVTGHDVLREYNVFQLSKNLGFWSPDNFNDAYNACLSVTVLPTFLDNLLAVYDPYIFKLFFQLIFAFAPVAIYLAARRYSSPGLAFLAAFFFVSFPTFFNDMPMLNRQEAAILFLALAAMAVFDKDIPRRWRQILFVVFGIGMILSHYATTYAFFAALTVCLILRPAAGRVGRAIKKRNWRINSGYLELDRREPPPRPAINIYMALLLLEAAFVWGSLVTDTVSDGISKIVSQTADALLNKARDDSRSADVQYSIFSWQKPDPQQALNEFQSKILPEVRAQGPEEIYYDLAAIGAVGIAREANLPITWLGRQLAATGVDIESFHYIFRQVLSRLLQLLVAVGFLWLLFSRAGASKIDTEYVLLAGGSLLFVLAQVVLPVLSVAYGALRSFQQALVFAGIFLVCGAASLAYRSGEAGRMAAATGLAMIFFISSSGLLTEMLGGFKPLLHLHNDGLYYDLYYEHQEERECALWLKDRMAPLKDKEYQSGIPAGRYASVSRLPVAGMDYSYWADIFPGLLRKDAYVLLGWANIKKGQAGVAYNSDQMRYEYPVEFLDENKNRLYDNGGCRVYK